MTPKEESAMRIIILESIERATSYIGCPEPVLIERFKSYMKLAYACASMLEYSKEKKEIISLYERNGLSQDDLEFSLNETVPQIRELTEHMSREASASSQSQSQGLDSHL